MHKPLHGPLDNKDVEDYLAPPVFLRPHTLKLKNFRVQTIDRSRESVASLAICLIINSTGEKISITLLHLLSGWPSSRHTAANEGVLHQQ